MLYYLSLFYLVIVLSNLVVEHLIWTIRALTYCICRSPEFAYNVQALLPYVTYDYDYDIFFVAILVVRSINLKFGILM